MIVIDASVLANVLGDDGPDGAVARDAIRGEQVAAPDLVDVETVSVLRRRWLAGDLTLPRFRRALEDLTDLPIARHPVLPLMPRAFELRTNVTPYDAAYIGLAEVLGCPLLTGDKRLAAAPGPRCAVRLLGP